MKRSSLSITTAAGSFKTRMHVIPFRLLQLADLHDNLTRQAFSMSRSTVWWHAERSQHTHISLTRHMFSISYKNAYFTHSTHFSFLDTLALKQHSSLSFTMCHDSVIRKCCVDVIIYVKFNLCFESNYFVGFNAAVLLWSFCHITAKTFLCQTFHVQIMQVCACSRLI